MQINIEKTNESTVISLQGRLDTVTAPSLEKEVSDLGDDVKALVIDMKELEYISSAGLRVLLFSQKKMNIQGSMKLINVCENIMDVFEMTGFADILVIE